MINCDKPFLSTLSLLEIHYSQRLRFNIFLQRHVNVNILSVKAVIYLLFVLFHKMFLNFLLHQNAHNMKYTFSIILNEYFSIIII
jgi:hypothetical protein